MRCTLVLLFAIFACACARVYISPEDLAKNPKLKWSKRIARDTSNSKTWDKQVGKGKVFGTLGQNDDGLFGQAGYKQDIFNDARGKLTGQAQGTRVLGPGGVSTSLGGRLDWSNKDAKAALDVSKQIGGRTKVQATGEGVWNIDKNTRLTTGGKVTQELGRGKPDIGAQATFTHDF